MNGSRSSKAKLPRIHQKKSKKLTPHKRHITTTPRAIHIRHNGPTSDTSSATIHKPNPFQLAQQLLSPVLTQVAHFASNSVKVPKSMIPGGKKATKRVAQDPNQINLGFVQRAQNALQLIQGSSPTVERTKSFNKIAHLENVVTGKVAQIEAYLSHPIHSYSLPEIITIYNEFKEIRFACPIGMWLDIMHMWTTVARQPGLDPKNKQKASKVPLELLDELFQVSQLGTYSVMKAKNLSIPEHMLKFNLRPNNKIFNICLITLRENGNHEGVLQLYDKYEQLLNEIPEVQYLPSPLLPEGPEKEQELVSRRLMAQRRNELQHTAALDKQVMISSSALERFDKVDQIMMELVTNRSYAPSATSTALYSDSLWKRGQHPAHILFFKEFFQPQIYIHNKPNRQDFLNQQSDIVENLVSSGSVVKTTTISSDADSTTNVCPSYHIKSTHSHIDMTLPEFFSHPNFIRQTTPPPRQNWLNLFASLAALHPMKADDSSTPQPDNSTASSLQIYDSNNHNNASLLCRIFSTHRDPKLLVRNKALRQHLYTVARDQYGIVIDKTFFESMISESPNYDDTLAFLDDFHTQLETLRVKFKENPWTSEEVAKIEHEKKLKSLLVVDLNVQQHDHRLREIFGRYADEVKQLGYDGKFYSLVHKKLLGHLLKTYQNDEISAEISQLSHVSAPKLRTSSGDVVDMFEIETVIDANGQLHKIKKLRLNPNSTTPNNGDNISFGDQNSYTKQSLFDMYRSKEAESKPTATSSSSDSSSHPHSLAEVPNDLQLPPQLSKSPLVSLVERFNEEVTTMLMSSTTRSKIKHILSSVQTVRAYQEAYGLPTDHHAESHYFDSLLLMARRNEVYPPVLSTSSSSLIKYHVTPYIPSFDGETVSMADGKPLMHFKDRIQHIHTSLLRREQQLQLTLHELEHSMDALATMKNELDDYGRLKQINLKILNDSIEALCELATDGAILRGPFDESNIFYYNAPIANQVLGELAAGRTVEGMKIDPSSGAKFVPGITEPHSHQIDHVDLHEYKHTALRLHAWCFAEMKSCLQTLLKFGSALTPYEAQSIPLLSPDHFGSLVTEHTYMPLLRACAAHGDFQNVLLLIESAHLHRNVVPTTNMLNQVAIAFMNSNKPRNAIGVLGVMHTASQAENRQLRTVHEAELRRAIIHGTAETVLETANDQLVTRISPNRATLTLLLSMYKEQGMLEHVEELWRRLAYIDQNNWTSFSAVEEQQMVAQVLGDELESTLTKNGNELIYSELRGIKKGQDLLDPSLSIENAYDKALNPAKNRDVVEALRHNEVRRNMKSLLRNRQVPSLLPKGVHDLELSLTDKREHLQLDSVGLTIMIQTFIQLGHPMHSLQLYLDLRQKMPIFPIFTPPHSEQFKKASSVNNALERAMLDSPLINNTDLDSMDSFINKQRDGRKILENALNPNPYQSISKEPLPSAQVKQSLVTNRDLILHANSSITTDSTGTRIESQTFYNMAALTPKMVQMENPTAETTLSTVTPRFNALINVQGQKQLLAGGVGGTGKENSFDQIINGLWPEVDALASIALYAYKKGEQYLNKMTASGKSVSLPPEIYEHALLLKESAETVIAGLKRYTVDHPFLPGDISTMIFYSTPGTQNNAVPRDAGVQITQPRLILPYLVDTEPIYRAVDRLVYSDIALEESVFKMRYKNLKPIGMQRWFTIFPTMINQCKAIQQSQIDRDDINSKLDTLRDDVEILLATGRRKPKYVQVAELVQKKALSGEALTFREITLVKATEANREEAGSQSTLSVGGLHRNAFFHDRGISHPSTKSLANPLPGVGKADISEFTQTTQSWVSNFNDFLKSKQKNDIFKSIQAANPLNQEETDKIKQKILQQTKLSSNPPSTQQQPSSNTDNSSHQQHNDTTQSPQPKPKFSIESMQTPKPPQAVFDVNSFDGEITPNSIKTQSLLKVMSEFSSQVPSVKFSSTKGGGDMANQRSYMQELREAEELHNKGLSSSTTDHSNVNHGLEAGLPMFPFLSAAEQREAKNPQQFLAKLRQELKNVNNDVVGFYPSTDTIDEEGGELVQFDTDNTAKARSSIRSVLPTKNPKKRLQKDDETIFGRSSYHQDFNENQDYSTAVSRYNKSVQDQQQNQQELNAFLADDAFTTSSRKQASNSSLQSPHTNNSTFNDDSNDEIAFYDAKRSMNFSQKHPQSKSQNSLLLPEVQQMKHHLSNQAIAQRNIMSQYMKKKKNLSDLQQHNPNTLTEMMSTDLTLLKPTYQKDSDEHHSTPNSAAEWLTPPTDLSIISDVTKRNVSTAKRFKSLPGVIDEDQIKETHARREFMQRISHGDTQPDRQLVQSKRPGSIHSSQHGPQSHLPTNQFRAPSSMAKLANTPDNEVSATQMGLDHEETRTKFTVRTHGVAMSDRPGTTTAISQEYLEKYLMGLGPDVRDKRSVKAHKQLETENAPGLVMDPFFIKSGGSHAPTTRGGTGANKNAGHAPGYGQGIHKFRDRAQAEVTSFAQKSRSILLEEFEAAAVPKNQSEMTNLEKEHSQMTRKEREEIEYRNLYEMGGDDDTYGSQAMSKTGKYSMLSLEDRQERDTAAKIEGFLKLENELESLFKSKDRQAVSQELANDTVNFSKTPKMEKRKRITEVFSSAMKHHPSKH